MPYYDPELIQTMRAALDEVISRIPADHATQALKAEIATFILGATAHGQTTFDGLVASASEQVQPNLSMLT